MKKEFNDFPRLALLFSLLSMAGLTHAVSVQDNLTGASSSLNWKSIGGACLTAGNNPTGSPIPACVGNPYYAGKTLTGGFTGNLPDPVGNGALRLTTGSPHVYQTGAVVSNFTFPSTQGLVATFTTLTYQGVTGEYDEDGFHFGVGASGADGLSFYLMDGAQPPSIGATGGALGYACSNTNGSNGTNGDKGGSADGVVGAYLGLGIDEFGNFLNQYDVAADGFGYQPGRIGMRGAGNIAWTWLNKNYPAFYPSSLSAENRTAAVQKTCKTGKLVNYSNPNNPIQLPTKVMDYPAIPGGYNVLPSSLKISNLTATKRAEATPISFQLKVTQDGLLSLAYSFNGGTYQPVLINQSITASNGPIPSSFRFGFAASTGGLSNIHEIACFKATPADQAASSGGLNGKQSGELKTGTQVYLAFFQSDNWWGRLTAQDLTYNSSTDTVSISPAINWDGSCVLTGGTCPTSGETGITAQSSNNRQILSWDGTKGIPFQWNNLTTAQKNAVKGTDSTTNARKRLLYLRGERTNEIDSSPGGNLFRARTSVLSDIIHSSPSWVGPPSAPYSAVWTDSLYTSMTMPENASTQTYPKFASSTATRQNVVYVGSNDGLLHGFRAGGFTSAGNYVDNATTPNDGKEVIAFMPDAVVRTIHNASTPALDFSSPQYAHKYFLDAVPSTGDLFYGGKWHTWLVSGVGLGGKTLFALDITNPANFSEANANSLIVGEWTSATLTCINVANCGTSLGNTFGSPMIRRFHNGAWGVVFGNGYDSSTGTAGIYIMTIDPSSGSQTTRFLNTGRGPSGGLNNGIASVTPADIDGDHIVDYVYAPDIFGNIWRFDVTNSNPTKWLVSTYGGTSATPLFSTPSGQPVTTAAMVLSTPSPTGAPRILVDFGTGKNVPATLTAPEQYASGAHNLYGIWDWDMSAWNALKSVQYASLAAPQTVTTSKLLTQSILDATGGFRTLSDNTICWAGLTACPSGNTHYGWKLALPETNEQIVFSPILANGAFIINTTTPADNGPLSCDSSVGTGWTMAISPVNGGAFSESFFADKDNNFVTIKGKPVNGIALSAVGSPSVVLAHKQFHLISQTTTGAGTAKKINPPVGNQGGRLNWLQLR